MDEKNIPEENLTQVIKEVSGKIDQSNSFGRTFFRGLLFGLGSAIGASIIAAIVVGALNYFIRSVDDVPVLKNFPKIERVK